VFWHPALDDVPKGAAIVVANEFFDALPVNQAVKTARGWHERQIEIGPDGNLAFTYAAEPTALFERLLPPAVREAPEHSIYEWRNDHVAMEIGRRITTDGGAALVIDYGHAASAAGETLQALSHHAFANPLTAPGTVDLTAHVDFEALARAAEAMGANSFGPIEQSQFLRNLGIETRAAALKAKAPMDVAAEIDAAVARLTGRSSIAMGSLFKAMAFAHPKLGTPAGFE
jgi:SAM-dependent MidA family methyltransferase